MAHGYVCDNVAKTMRMAEVYWRVHNNCFGI